MILLQEAMAVAPYMLLLLVLIVAGIAIVVFLISDLTKQGKQTVHGPKENDTVEEKQSKIFTKGKNVSAFVIIGIVLWGLLSLLNWMCNIKFD